MSPEAPDEPSDDETILNDEALWRRIKAHKGWLDSDGRPTSAAFKDNTPGGGLSVHRSSLTTIDKVCETFPEYGVWSVLAGVPRVYEHIVVGDPTELDPSHALVLPRLGATKSQRMEAARRMAAAAQMVRPVP